LSDRPISASMYSLGFFLESRSGHVNKASDKRRHPIYVSRLIYEMITPPIHQGRYEYKGRANTITSLSVRVRSDAMKPLSKQPTMNKITLNAGYFIVIIILKNH
jgi:hypothetical protein